MATVMLLGLITCSDQSTPTESSFSPDAPSPYPAPTGLLTEAPAIFVGAGDIAKCTSNSDELTAQLLDALPDVPVFTLGDNTYSNGTAAEFTNCYEPTWGRHKARTFPSPGNTDYATSGAQPYFNYFGAAAGPPGQPGYYSFDLGQWHVISLNSNISKTPSSAQMQWLRADLAAHPNVCTLAYWHHPLYSSVSGSGSGGATYSSVRPLWDTLYAYGVDLILNGHRHSYERIAPIKPNGAPDPTFGIRTILAGSGGTGGLSFTNIFPQSEVRNGNTRGVLKLYLYGNSSAWKFIPVAGKTFTDSGSTACHSPPGSQPVATALGFVVQPSTTVAGAAITPAVQVEIRDQFGARLPGATHEVTVALGTSPAGGTLAGTTTVAAVDGVATFTGLSIDNIGSGYTLAATSTGLTGATSDGFDITATPPVGITHSLLTAGNSIVTQNSYTTASIAPAPNTLVTIALLSRRSSAAISPTVAGGGMASWTLVASVDFDTLSLPHRRLSIYHALSAAPGSGPLTFTFSNQVSNLDWIVSQWGGVETSGVNGAGAIGQTGSTRADEVSGLSVSLAPFGDPNNVAFGVFGVNSRVLAITPGAGFTEISEQPANESTGGDLQAQWAVDQNIIGASWTNLRGGALGLELKAKTFP